MSHHNRDSELFLYLVVSFAIMGEKCNYCSVPFFTLVGMLSSGIRRAIILYSLLDPALEQDKISQIMIILCSSTSGVTASSPTP